MDTRAPNEQSDSSQAITSPFGAPSIHIQTLRTAYLVEMYRRKCGVDIERCFHGHASIDLHECAKTGYRFWRPAEIAADEWGYRQLSKAWPNYYRTNRWEYAGARRALVRSKRVLEVGCGRGFFLRALEGHIPDALGIELNAEAVARKVTRFPVAQTSLEELSASGARSFDAVCAFQVLEHLASPASFFDAALNCLSSGGLLILSTPNHAYARHQHQEDAFDLPPHHMGHFLPETFRKLALLYDLDVVDIAIQHRPYEPSPVTDRAAGNPWYLAARLIATINFGLAFRLSKEPGPNLLAILRKR